MKNYLGLAMCFLLFFSFNAFAIRIIGNGGDGVVQKNDSIILYDFYEKSLNFEESMTQIRQYKNATILKMLKNIKADTTIWNHLLVDSNETLAVLESVLSRIMRLNPYLVQVILKELKEELTWTGAPVDLKANTDTQSPLDENSISIIGCAQTREGKVLYSPSCAGPKMNSINKAGLVLHEVLYNIFRKLGNTDDSSYRVREVVVKIFSINMLDLNTVLKANGFKDLVELNYKMNSFFFKDSEYWQVKLKCLSGNMNLSFRSPYNIWGDLKGAPIATGPQYDPEHPDLISGVEEEKWGYQYWPLFQIFVPDFIYYNVNEETVAIFFERDESSFRVQINFKNMTVVTKLWNNWEDEAWQNETGTCEIIKFN